MQALSMRARTGAARTAAAVAGALLLLFVAGCGSSRTDTTTDAAGAMDAVDPAASFLGTWNQIQTLTADCDDGTGGTTESFSMLSVTPGTVSDLVRTSISPNACPMPLDILADPDGGPARRAELHATTNCSMGDLMLVIAAWSFNLTGDGSAAESGSGTIAVPSGSCAAVFTTTLTR